MTTPNNTPDPHAVSFAPACFVRLPELAEALGGLFTLAWLRQETRAGRLPCLRIGTRVVYDVDAVRNELAQRARDKSARPARHRQKAAASQAA